MKKFVCKDCGKSANKEQVELYSHVENDVVDCIFLPCGGVMVEVDDKPHGDSQK